MKTKPGVPKQQHISPPRVYLPPGKLSTWQKAQGQQHRENANKHGVDTWKVREAEDQQRLLAQANATDHQHDVQQHELRERRVQRANRARKRQTDEEVQQLEKAARAGVHAAQEVLHKLNGSYGSGSDGEEGVTPYESAMREEQRLQKLGAIRRAQEEAARPPSPKTQKMLDEASRKTMAARISKREAVKREARREQARETKLLARRREHHQQQGMMATYSDSDSDEDIMSGDQHRLQMNLKALEQQLASSRVQPVASSYISASSQLPAKHRA